MIKGQRGLIRREMRAARTKIRGVVVSEPRQTYFRPTQADANSFVCDVDAGGGRILRNVVIKIHAGRDRGYAAVGRPVWLERNAGRWQITGPADRQVSQGSLTEWDPDLDTTTAGAIGHTFRREIFDFYKGELPTSYFDPDSDPDTLVWIDMSDESTLTVSGGVITDVLDKSGNGYHLSSLGTGQDPTQVQNAGLNDLYAADFDGINDHLEFDVNVDESTPGEVSIFIYLNKEAVGSGDDTVLNTQRWEIRSRDSAWDRWTVNSGGVDADSGSTLGSTFVLIELIARGFNDFDLYEDGTLLGTFTPTASGQSNASSQLGDHRSYVRHHDGVIAEVLIIDRTVSTADREAIEAYFATKYDVEYSLWNDGVTPFPKTSIIDANGDIV